MIEITVKNRTVTASEWLSWRKQGVSNTEIAVLLGISPSMARIIARKFRQTGVPDPQYRKKKPGPIRSLDTSTDAGAYVLGTLWGLVSLNEDGYWLRHRNKWYIDLVREQLSITAEGHASYSTTGVQYRLKITRAADVATVRQILMQHNWAPRNAPKRPYPLDPLNDKGFVRAWVELHSSIDVARTGRNRVSLPRLRIYGNRILLEEMNQVIAAGTGLPPRTLQKTANEATKALYYTGKSCREVLTWLYIGAELYNDAVKEKALKKVLC